MPGFTYFDTHCHLAARHFSADADQVAERSLAAGVGMLTVGGDIATSRRSLELARKHDGVWAAVGVHPCDIGTLDETGWREIVTLAADPKVVAIGETGLDYYWKDTAPEDQRRWFARHAELSLATGKPLSIHARDSVPDMMAFLEPYFPQGLKAIWHCFVAPKKDIARALDYAVRNGLYLGVGGLATFEDQKPLRAHIPLIPDELLLLETDSPYLIPRPKTMDRNEPLGVVRVAEELARLRHREPAEIAALTTSNALSLLGF